MSRNNSSGKSGKPDPRRGGGFRRPQQTEKQPAVASGLSRSTVTSDLRMLSANANSDELDKWLKSLQTHSTLTFDEGVIEKYFQDPLYTYRQPAAPVVPDPDDEEEVQELNPDFNQEEEESEANPRVIIVTRFKYPHNANGNGLSAEGKRLLDTATRTYEHLVKRWLDNNDKVTRELRKAHTLITVNLDESAKTHMSSAYGDQWSVYDENSTIGIRVLIDRIKKSFGRGIHAGKITSQVDLNNLRTDAMQVRRRDGEGPSDFARRVTSKVEVHRSAYIEFGTTTQEQKDAKAAEWDQRYGASFAVDIFISNMQIPRFDYKLKNEPHLNPYPVTLQDAVIQAQNHLRMEREDPVYCPQKGDLLKITALNVTSK